MCVFRRASSSSNLGTGTFTDTQTVQSSEKQSKVCALVEILIKESASLSLPFSGGRSSNFSSFLYILLFALALESLIDFLRLRVALNQSSRVAAAADDEYFCWRRKSDCLADEKNGGGGGSHLEDASRLTFLNISRSNLTRSSKSRAYRWSGREREKSQILCCFHFLVRM